MTDLTRTFLWRKLREQKILRAHRRVARICDQLIADFKASPYHFESPRKQEFPSGKIIWQYWAQGFADVPARVRECLDSVDKYADGYTVVRLSDADLDKYLDIPDFVLANRSNMGIAHFSDLLRLMLLKTYGGIWMDATILLTGPVPAEYADQDLFLFRRDPAEPDKKYWRNVFAYYFGWAKGFRVNMLSSFIVAKRGNRTVSDLCDIMLQWWQTHTALPDYFFFQILFDCYGDPGDFPLVSDTLPHYLQQSINDPNFNLMPRERIETSIPVHKLTYK